MDGLASDTELVRELVKFAGTTAAGVARAAGVAVTTVNRPYNGSAETRLSRRTIEKLQEAFPQFPGWAALKQDSLTADRTSLVEGETLEIPMLELGYGMGGTFIDDADVGQQIELFPAAFIRKFTRSPASFLAWADGIGDSMYPTIGDRDLLLIDRSIDTIGVNDQVWALASGGIGMVKRVRMKDGQVHLMSDNPHVSDYTAGEDELSVIGRVIAIVRRI